MNITVTITASSYPELAEIACSLAAGYTPSPPPVVAESAPPPPPPVVVTESAPPGDAVQGSPVAPKLRGRPRKDGTPPRQSTKPPAPVVEFTTTLSPEGMPAARFAAEQTALRTKLHVVMQTRGEPFLRALLKRYGGGKFSCVPYAQFGPILVEATAANAGCIKHPDAITEDELATEGSAS